MMFIERFWEDKPEDHLVVENAYLVYHPSGILLAINQAICRTIFASYRWPFDGSGKLSGP